MSDEAYEAQLSQEHDGMEFPIAFLSHTFSETQRRWSTAEQKATKFTIQSPNGTIISKE